MRDIACFSSQQDVGWPLISISARLQHDEIDLGLCQGLDWREVMSWYTRGGATFTAEVIAHQEMWSLDASSWRHWDPGGFANDRFRQRLIWDPGIEESIHGGLTQE